MTPAGMREKRQRRRQVADESTPDFDEPPLEVLTDDAAWDEELQALVAIASMLEPLDPAARYRVMLWARSRFLPNHVLVAK